MISSSVQVECIPKKDKRKTWPGMVVDKHGEKIKKGSPPGLKPDIPTFCRKRGISKEQRK
jgi:hypothetical protein